MSLSVAKHATDQYIPSTGLLWCIRDPSGGGGEQSFCVNALFDPQSGDGWAELVTRSD